MKNYFYLIFSALLIGCASSRPTTVTIFDKENMGANKIYHVSYDASRRGSLIYQDNGKVYVLSEPPPDVATKLATEIGAKANVFNKVNAEVYLSTTKAIAELGKRTAAVNILRDALYKLSEIKMAGNLDKTAEKLFEKILEASIKISNLEIIQAETENIEAKVKAEKFNIELGAKQNYQIALKSLIAKDFKTAKKIFDELYAKYPFHFNIDEIRTKLSSYNVDDMDTVKWNEIYDFLLKNPYGIDTELIEAIKTAKK